MKLRDKLMVVLFAAVFVSSISISMVNATPSNEADDPGIVVSDAGERERWFDNRWHNRRHITVTCNDLAPLRRGRVVKYQLDLADITDLDPNSIRLLLNGIEVPFDFDIVSGILTFVVSEPMGIGGLQNLVYTLYYDSVPNGIKPKADFNPSWATEYIAAYENGTLGEEAKSKKEAWMAERQIREENGVYYYGDEMVYEDGNGNYYYKNGTQVVSYITVDELEVGGIPVGKYVFVAPDGMSYNVERIGNDWVYTENGSIVGDADTLNKVYNYGDMQVIYNITSQRWEYLNNSILLGYALYDNGTDYYYYYAFNETNDSTYYDGKNAIVVPSGDDFYIVTAMLDNSTDTLYVYNATLDAYESVPYEILDQTVYMGYSVERGLLDALTVNDGLTMDWNVGNVELLGTGSSSQIYTDENATTSTVNETVTLSAYRGSPDIFFNSNITSEEDISQTLFGSVLFNLDGVLELGDGNTSDIVPFDEVKDYLIQQLYLTGIGAQYFELVTAWEDEAAMMKDLINDWIVISDGYSFNLDDLDWVNDAYNLTGVYFTGNPNAFVAPDYELKVIPKLMSSDYFGLYNMRYQRGLGIKFQGLDALRNILLETWQETYTDPVTLEFTTNIYVNISFNYVGAWYDPSFQEKLNENIILGQTNQLYGVISYLETLDPIYMLDSLLTNYENVNFALGDVDPAIPINITVNSPLPGSRINSAEDLVINITVAGETLSHVEYFLDVDGVVMSFDTWNEVIIGEGNTKHVGRRMGAVRKVENIGRATVNILAYDTNGKVILAQADIIVDGEVVEDVVWTITIGSIATILGLLGFASVKNRKLNRCVGDVCNIK